MADLTIQIHHPPNGWLDAGEVIFHAPNDVSIEYDLSYAVANLGATGRRAFSVRLPVDIALHRGPLPGFLVDLVPQGPALRRLLERYGIARDDNYHRILSACPLASPGNIRIKEPWESIDRQRPTYSHPGFSKAEIIAAKVGFIDYMEQHGAPIGGTSGAAGGAPKFLLREDERGHFHADGLLSDDKTKQAFLIKFLFSDSSNAQLIANTEKAYHDLLRDLPVMTAGIVEMHDDILFIPRFDRIRNADGQIDYHGLESLYSANGVNTFGLGLAHEDNLQIIKHHCDNWQLNVAEYIVRDILNLALSNTDNHGRNTSLIKRGGQTTLSPIYDVTAMRFFKGDFILPLTKWRLGAKSLRDRLTWITEDIGLKKDFLNDYIVDLRNNYLLDLEARLHGVHVPEEIIKLSKEDRDATLAELKSL